MFLTPDELRTLTGRKRRKDQVGWLRAGGWRFEENAAGCPVVSRDYVQSRLGTTQRPIPGFDHIRKRVA
jgi:hypothetical protein